MEEGPVKVLVTGSAGFIGQHLIKRLSAMYSASSQPIEIDIKFKDEDRGVDIRDAKAMKRFGDSLGGLEDGIDACIHLAAIAAPRQAEADPQLAWETNVRGTYNVLTLCRELGIRKFVFMSSAHVYGISPKYMPSDEWHPLSLLDTYTSTKIAGEKLCELFHSNYGLSTTCLRLFNAYGPGQSKDYFIGAKIEQAKAGGPVTLMNGEVTKDWVWVEDVVDAITRSLRTDYVGPINIGTGVETNLRTIATEISQSFDVELVADQAVDNGPTHMMCNNFRARDILRWSPKVTFFEGLTRLIEVEKSGKLGSSSKEG
jgi:nucleoside-diphosphate-sugar epimerase